MRRLKPNMPKCERAKIVYQLSIDKDKSLSRNLDDVFKIHPGQQNVSNEEP